MRPPEIEKSTRQEREAFIRKTYRCIADCDACGICQVFRGKEPMIVFDAYIQGREAYQDICEKYR